MARALYDGDRERIRRALHRMSAGEPSVVSLVGGSVTVGMGSQDMPGGSWTARLDAWLQLTFPKGNVRVVNSGVSALGSVYMAVCVKAHVPPEADLVFVEFAINDAHTWQQPMEHDTRRSWERLLRRLLELPNRPAVVLLNSYSWFQTTPPGKYYSNAEAVYFEFATYYGLPLLSLKAAAYHLMTADVKGFSVETMRYLTKNNESTSKDTLFYMDPMHPSGHTGHRALADLAIYSLIRVRRGLDTHPLQARELVYVNAPLPRPMLEGNLGLSNDTCFLGSALQGVVLNTAGFEWHNEAAADKVPKWGYTGRTAHAVIRLRFSTLTAAPSGPLGGSAPPANVTVHLVFLRSYEQMGKALIQCVAGCACAEHQFDGHHPGERTSKMHVHAFAATQSPGCTVQVTILEATASGQRKVKIGGLMISETLDKPMEMGAVGNEIHRLSTRLTYNSTALTMQTGYGS